MPSNRVCSCANTGSCSTSISLSVLNGVDTTFTFPGDVITYTVFDDANNENIGGGVFNTMSGTDVVINQTSGAAMNITVRAVYEC